MAARRQQYSATRKQVEKKKEPYDSRHISHLPDVLARDLRPRVPEVVRLGVAVLVLLHVLLENADAECRSREHRGRNGEGDAGMVHQPWFFSKTRVCMCASVLRLF